MEYLETDVKCYGCDREEKHLPHFRMVRMCEDCIESILESEEVV